MGLKKTTYLFLFLLSAQSVFSAAVESIANGNWNNQNTWDCACPNGPADTDDVTIKSGHTVKLTSNEIAANLTVESSGVLDDNGNALTITGNLLLNGTITGSSDFTMNGAGATIDGAGVINSTGKWIFSGGNKTILATADLIKSAGETEVDPDAVGLTVTNNGKIAFADQVKGGDASTTWTNNTDSYLKIKDQFFSNGVLEASASGNTVEYYGGAQDIKTPVSSYYHLKITGSDIKKMLASLTIDGHLTITSVMEVNGFDITIRGNWNNSGVFEEEVQTVTFDGASSQAITNSSGETFNNLTIDKSGGILTLINNVTVSDELTMTQGNIDPGSNILTLGTGTGNVGTLSHASGTITGQFERWLNATGTYLYPVGISSDYRPASITLNNITGGSLIVNFIASDPGNNGLSLVDGAETVYNSWVEGYWNFQPANSFVSTDYDIGLTGNGFSSFTITAASPRILTRASGGDPWIAEGTHISPSGNTATRETVTTGFPAHHAWGDTTNCTAPPPPTITGDTSVCASETGVVYSVAADPDYTYSWTVTGGTINTDNGDNITVDWGATGTIGEVEIVVENTCTKAAPVDTAVNIHSIPPPAITGKMNVAESTTAEPYSVTGENGYTYSWSISPGTIASGDGTTDITVDFGAAGDYTLSVTADSGNCPAATVVDTIINVYNVIISEKNGEWWRLNPNPTWDCNCVPQPTDNVIVKHAVTVHEDRTVNNFEIQAGGTLNDNGNKLNVTGDFTVNGDYTGTGELTLSGAGTLIDGTGDITNTNKMLITSGNKTILSSTVLTKATGNMDVANNVLIENNGSFTLGGNLLGGNNNTHWQQNNNSTLNIGGELLATGKLTASATGNIVNYNGTVAQTVKSMTVTTQYYHLTLEGSDIKSLSDDTDIDGNLLIDGTADLDVTASNHQITLAGNWTNNGTFNEQLGTVEFDGAGTQTITNGSGETFHNVTFNNVGGSVLLDAGTDVTIAGAATFTDGIVDGVTNGSMVIFNDDATVSGASGASFVHGVVRKTGNDAFTFPVGSTSGYRSIAISAPAVSTDQFDASHLYADPHPTYDESSKDATINHISSCEYWILDRTAGTSDVYVTLSWEDVASCGVDAYTELTLARWDGAQWRDHTSTPSGTNASGTIVTDNPVTSFSPFTLASTTLNNPLPINLLSFEASPSGQAVLLKWITASEINNDFFTIEKTADGTSFQTVANVPGAGNSNESLDYSVMDEAPYDGISYYRLKQTDFNGGVSYSDLVAVEFKPNHRIAFNIYPNPSEGNFFVSAKGLSPEKEVLVVILDVLGQIKYSTVVLADGQGSFVTAFDRTKNISSGIYTIMGTQDDQIYQKKLVVK